MSNSSQQRPWWKGVVVYQVYPRSFSDSNGDGIGDLGGITSRLDYLQDLGVDALWLSPIFASPNDDNGYDISDYRAIMTEFGTMADFDELLAGLHRRGMRLILDLVVNHTSDEHPWFIESRRSADSPKRDWYIWRPPRADRGAEAGSDEGGTADVQPGSPGSEPNNWASFFSPSAWEYDAGTGEYYLHLFSKKQPDLNWKNPAVREEVYEMMAFWLEKGIDGYRMDVINFLAKPPGLPDAPPSAFDALQNKRPRYVFPAGLIANQPGMHEILQEMNRSVLSRYDIMTVGECHFITAEDAVDYVDPKRKELDMVFQFDTLRAEGNIDGLKRAVRRWYETLKARGHNTISFANHDVPRQVSRFLHAGNPAGSNSESGHAEAAHRYRVPAAKLLNTAVLTLPGTPFLYQGDEIGMTNVALPSIDDYRDIETIHRFEQQREQGASVEEALAIVRPTSRDNSRTPMQWSNEENAGFTTGTPWLAVNPNYPEINVQRSLEDPNSILNYVKRLLALRRRTEPLVYGEYVPIETNVSTLYIFERASADVRIRVSLNFANTPTTLPTEVASEPGRLLLTNYSVAQHEATSGDSADSGGGGPRGNGELAPWEARIERLSGSHDSPR